MALKHLQQQEVVLEDQVVEQAMAQQEVVLQVQAIPLLQLQPKVLLVAHLPQLQ